MMFQAEWSALAEPPVPPVDLWHMPVPGPAYWEYRCLVCGEAVAAHPSLPRRLLRRWRRWRARYTSGIPDR